MAFRDWLSQALAKPFDEFIHSATHQQFGQILASLTITTRAQPNPLLLHSLASAQQGRKLALHQLLHAPGERPARLKSLVHHHPDHQSRRINAIANDLAGLPLQQAKQLGGSNLHIQVQENSRIGVSHSPNITLIKCFG